MTAEILQLRRSRTVDEAWELYLKLVNERAEQDLWRDLEHNKRIARAWDEWSKLYLAWWNEQ